VLLVSWNGWGLLRPCLTSLADALRAASADAEVLVVDNGSVDGTAEGLAAEFPWVRRIDAGRNLGFALANNLGAAEARGELLFLLNNDTIVDRESVAELLRAADAHPEFALFAPEMRGSSSLTWSTTGDLPRPQRALSPARRRGACRARPRPRRGVRPFRRRVPGAARSCGRGGAVRR
jgi:GT2 family glycosyltransferase